jgi:hypothetical protein
MRHRHRRQAREESDENAKQHQQRHPLCAEQRERQLRMRRTVGVVMMIRWMIRNLFSGCVVLVPFGMRRRILHRVHEVVHVRHSTCAQRQESDNEDERSHAKHATMTMIAAAAQVNFSRRWCAPEPSAGRVSALNPRQHAAAKHKRALLRGQAAAQPPCHRSQSLRTR